MPSLNPSLAILRRVAPLLALLAAVLLASPASAFTVKFDAASGFGLSEATADAAFDAGFARLTPPAIAQGSTFGITIPDPVVLSAALSGSPTTTPTTVSSRWTVNNGGRTLIDPWLVFLRPQTYSGPLVGIDMTPGGQWALVQMTVGSGEGATEYFYPAVRLGHLAANGSASFVMNHVIATTLVQSGNQLVLPRYGVGLLGSVPEPATVSLFAVVLAGLLLRRRGLA
jgi:hypothetical protein